MSVTPSRSASATGIRPTKGKRQSEFTLPDGTRVLVALPSDYDHVRRKYPSNKPEPNHLSACDEPSTQIEVVVHGSPEHTAYLQTAKDHHERRRAELEAKLGSDVLAEWDELKHQVDEMTRMMERAVDQTSRLNANFEKFGFHAKLRTWGDELEERESRGRTGRDEESTYVGKEPGADSVSSGGAWSERRHESTTLKLYKKPVIKQYFHRGLLWRSSEETKVMSFELFFDLLYVGIIAINGDNAAEEANGHGLLRFVVTFGMSWKIWNDVQQFVSWFDADDVVHRVEIVFLIACLLGYGSFLLQ